MCDTDIGELPMSAYDHLGQDALCAICYQASEDNVSMCKQGHNACRTCADKVWNSRFADKCPIGCSELHRPGGAWVSNRALNEVIKVTPFKCPNSKGGCKHSSRLCNMKEHTETCGYEEVACQVVACKWRGPKCKLSEHMDEVNHSRYFVDMLLFTQQGIVTTDKELQATRAELTALKQATEHKDEVVDKRLGALNDLFDNLHKTCQAIEGKVSSTRFGGGDGTSARTQRRDKQTAKTVEAKDGEIADLTKQLAERPPQEFVDAMSADLMKLPSIEQWERTQDQLNNSCRARDRFFRERDEARAETQAFIGQKRRMESDFSELEAANRCVNGRLHEAHATLSRMLPHAAPRNCPCNRCAKDPRV